jgi:hypothetical protein
MYARPACLPRIGNIYVTDVVKADTAPDGVQLPRPSAPWPQNGRGGMRSPTDQEEMPHSRADRRRENDTKEHHRNSW